MMRINENKECQEVSSSVGLEIRGLQEGRERGEKKNGREVEQLRGLHMGEKRTKAEVK